MADCPCTILPTTTSIAVTSGNVTYDGAATCTGFNSGDTNDFITHITAIVCALQASLAALTLDTDDITITGLSDLACITASSYSNASEYLNALASILCQVNADLAALDVSDVGGTFDLSCINAGYAADSLEDAIVHLTAAVCAINSGQNTSDLLMDGGSLGLPLLMFAKDAVTITDISALGVAKVNIDATDYWINAQALSMVGTNINLVNSQDNYIFIDKVTKLYTVSPVAIGGATPATNGDKVAMVRTGVGTVSSITLLIGYSPIDSDILEDNSIDATKLTTTIATAPIRNDGSNIVLDIDNDDFDVSGGDLILKAGCIRNTSYLNVPAIAEPSIKLSGGTKLQVGVQNSVELDAGTGLVQLENDAASPGNNYVYGTNSIGSKGWQEIQGLKKTTYTLTPAEILSLNSSPVTIIAQPGAAYAIYVHKVVCSILSAGTAYTSANALEFRYTDGSGTKVSGDVPNTFIESATADIYVVNGVTGSMTMGAPIVACVPVADPTVGNKSIKVVVYWTVESRP